MAKTAKDRDRALAMDKANEGAAEPEAEVDGDANMEEDEETPEEALGSKVIVIHLGSQNLRIGLASDALPKTLPMVIARKSGTNEAEEHDEPKPKRLKLDDGSVMEPEKMFGPEVCSVSGLYPQPVDRISSPRSLRPCARISKFTCDRTSAGHFQIRKRWSSTTIAGRCQRQSPNTTIRIVLTGRRSQNQRRSISSGTKR